MGIKDLKGPSKHLTWAELACKDGTEYPDEFVRDGRVFTLAGVFEEIRSMCGNVPLTIDSAYRTPAHNRKIGGAKNSQHVQGRALDLRPPKGMAIGEFYETIRLNVERLGIHGIGLYDNFVHVDIRPIDSLVVWNGNGTKDSGTNA